MEIEGVIGLLVLALYVWSLIRRKKKKERIAAASAPKQGLMSQLTDRIRLFVGELEKKAAETRKAGEGVKNDASMWDRLSGDKHPPQWQRDEVADEDDAPLGWELDSWEPDSVEVEDEPAPSAKVPPPPVTVPPPVVAKPMSVTGKLVSQPGHLYFTPDTLRNAVVWSEILSPPLALRKDGRRYF